MEEGIFESYVESALWSTTDMDSDTDECLDANYSISDLAPETRKVLYDELETFMPNFNLVMAKDRSHTISQFVHDFWLTRNGHGAGFWDGDYQNGERLTELSSEYGAVDLYVGDDKKIYSM